MTSPRPRLSALVLLVCVVACERKSSDTTSSAPSAAPAPSASETIRSPFDPEKPPDRLAPPEAGTAVGEWAKTEDYRMRVVSVRTCEVEVHFQPKPGHVVLGVEVQLAGLSDHEVPVNPLHAKLVDSEGNSHAATLVGCRPNLPAQRIQKGFSTKGYVNFDVPETASGFELRYEPFVVGRSDSALEFVLPR